MQRVIGIDFGTSTTYMNVKRYNGAEPAEDRLSYMPVMFNYGQSNGCVASIVRENADGTFDFGEKATEPLEGSVVHTEVKMRLESQDAAARDKARQITREFFRFLHETYAQQASNLGGAGDTEETLVSYPVKWQPETVQFMLDAAKKAGFQNVRGIDEATAAVSAVAAQNPDSKLLRADRPGYLLLLDMGAGTTDLVVCRYRAPADGGVDVKMVTNWPQSTDEPTFGGREVDAVLERYVEDYLASALEPGLAGMAHRFATSPPGQAKKWKESNVSLMLAENKPVTTCGYISAYGPMLRTRFPAFDRAGFEKLIQSGLQDYARLIDGCLKKTAEVDKGFAGKGLDLVILTGGHSAWYFARSILDGTMEGYLENSVLKTVRAEKQRVISMPNPQTIVALGLVYGKLAGQKREDGGGPSAEGAETSGPSARQMLDNGLAFYNDAHDYRTAVMWFEKAAAQDEATAQFMLGQCYENGTGVPADRDMACQWYSKAVLNGNDVAKQRLHTLRLELAKEKKKNERPPEPEKPEPKQTQQQKTERRERMTKSGYTLTVRRKFSLQKVCYMKVDGEEMYELKTSSATSFNVSPGTHTLMFTYGTTNTVWKAAVTFAVSKDLDMDLRVTKDGMRNVFTLFEGNKIIGTMREVKVKEEKIKKSRK